MKPACAGVCCVDFEEGWSIVLASGHRAFAAGMESAAVWEFGCGGDLAFDGLEPAAAGVVGGERIEESFGVGVFSGCEELLYGRVFDDVAGVHDGDVVGHFGDDAEVVGDEYDGHASILLEFPEQVEDLGLDGDVEGGGGFVGDEKLGIAGEGHCDHDALPHAAGELVGVVVDAVFGGGDADLVDEIDGLAPCLRFV